VVKLAYFPAGAEFSPGSRKRDLKILIYPWSLIWCRGRQLPCFLHAKFVMGRKKSLFGDNRGSVILTGFIRGTNCLSVILFTVKDPSLINVYGYVEPSWYS